MAFAAHGLEEKRLIYPEQQSWTHLGSRAEFEAWYPYMPDRIIDNLLAPRAYISVVPWNRITTHNLEFSDRRYVPRQGIIRIRSEQKDEEEELLIGFILGQQFSIESTPYERNRLANMRRCGQRAVLIVA